MILIDMDMPESCSDCQLLSEEVWCKITGASVWQNGIDYNKERLPDCPIVAYMAKGGVQTQKNRPTDQ